MLFSVTGYMRNLRPNNLDRIIWNFKKILLENRNLYRAVAHVIWNLKYFNASEILIYY